MSLRTGHSTKDGSRQLASVRMTHKAAADHKKAAVVWHSKYGTAMEEAKVPNDIAGDI